MSSRVIRVNERNLDKNIKIPSLSATFFLGTVRVLISVKANNAVEATSMDGSSTTTPAAFRAVTPFNASSNFFP
jgi:hypothetical protein